MRQEPMGWEAAAKGGEEATRRRVLFLLVGGCFAAPFLASLWRRGGLQDEPLTDEARRGAPRELSFDRAEGGGEWSLADERGTVVLLNIWATWCGPCQAETPLLVRVSEEKDVRVAGLSLDTAEDRLGRIAAFARRYGVQYPLLLPGSGSHLVDGVRALPTTMLFDRKGRLAVVMVGELDERLLRAKLAALLAEQA